MYMGPSVWGCERGWNLSTLPGVPGVRDINYILYKSSIKSFLFLHGSAAQAIRMGLGAPAKPTAVGLSLPFSPQPGMIGVYFCFVRG